MPSVIKSRSNQITPLSAADIPEGHDAKVLYERLYSGQITEEHPFGEDPLSESQALCEERDTQFAQMYDVAFLYREVVNERLQSFQDAIMFFVNITVQLSLRL